MSKKIWKQIKKIASVTLVLTMFFNLFNEAVYVHARQKAVERIYNVGTYTIEATENEEEKEAHVFVSFPVDNLKYEQTFFGFIHLWEGLSGADENYLGGNIKPEDFEPMVGDMIGEIRKPYKNN